MNSITVQDMGLRKKLNFELPPDQEGFLMLMCFLACGLIGALKPIKIITLQNSKGDL